MTTIVKLAKMLTECYEVLSDFNRCDTPDYIFRECELNDLIQLLQLLHNETGLGISPDELIRAKEEMLPSEFYKELKNFIKELEP